MANAHRAKLHSLTITEPRLRGRLELVWRANGPATPAATALIAHANRRLGR